MLTFLKRMQGARDNRKGRLINLMICSMHILTPVLALYSIMITLGQQSDLRQVVKTYVMLGFIMNVDVLVAKDFPDEVLKNAEEINKLGGLRISKDYNLYSLIFARMSESPGMLLHEIPNILANLWFSVLINF
jgi:ABC-type maltose transport system permease subunit